MVEMMDKISFEAFVAALRDMHNAGLEIGYIAVEEFKGVYKHPMTGVYHYDSITRYSYYPPKSPSMKGEYYTTRKKK